MTPKDRVLDALHHKQPDIVPYNISWDTGVREVYARWCGDSNFDRDIINHFEYVCVGTRSVDLPDNEWVDDWGCHFKQGATFHLVDTKLTEPTLDDVVFPDLSEAWRYQDWTETIGKSQERFIIAAYFGGLFERGWMLRGMENWLVDLAENERFVEDLLDGMLRTFTKFVDAAGRQDGVDAILIGDDYGQQHGLIMGPVIWRKYFKPRLSELFNRIHAHGKYAAIHCCGDASLIMEDLAEIGLDIFNPFQPEAMNIIDMKREYGSRLTFNGGIGTQGYLVHGTPEDVRRQVRFVLDEIGRNGGLVVETTKPLRAEVPMDNIAALLDELSHQER